MTRKLSDGACPEDEALWAVLNRNQGDNTALQNLYETEYQKGYEAARQDALKAIHARAEMWREKERQKPEITTSYIKVRIAEDFECSEAILRIGMDDPKETEQL